MTTAPYRRVLRPTPQLAPVPGHRFESHTAPSIRL